LSRGIPTEMNGQQERVVETLENPDILQEGDLGTLMAIRLFAQTPLTRKHLVVVYRELGDVDGFVLTAYFTNAPSRGRKTVWTR